MEWLIAFRHGLTDTQGNLILAGKSGVRTTAEIIRDSIQPPGLNQSLLVHSPLPRAGDSAIIVQEVFQCRAGQGDQRITEPARPGSRPNEADVRAFLARYDASIPYVTLVTHYVILQYIAGMYSSLHGFDGRMVTPGVSEGQALLINLRAQTIQLV